MLTEEYQNLLYGIFEKAFEDYSDLRNRGVTKHKSKDSGVYSIIEIRSFLRSEWCNTLLRGMGRDNDPETISIINSYITGSVDKRLCSIG